MNTTELNQSRRLPDINNIEGEKRDPNLWSPESDPIRKTTSISSTTGQQQRTYDSDVTDSSSNELIFNWDSSYGKENMERFNTATAQQLQFLDQMFNDNGRKTDGLIKDAHDWDGKRIINNTSAKQWFKDYVALVFSIGCIFNSTDQTKLNEILKLFENSGNYGFLMNYHKVMSYEDELVQAIEKKMEIGNGNYHVCLITIVQTKDPSVLERAPEQKYHYSGTIEKFCEWPDIYNYMKTIVARYGLITPNQPTIIHKTAGDKATWEIGNEGLATKTARHNEVESSFDIDIDPDDENQISLYQDLEFKHERDEHFKPRIREPLRARASENDNPQRMRNLYNKSLYSRIAESIDSSVTADSTVDEHKGVQLRMNESKQPPPKRTAEYQLYDDDSTYQDGKNVILFTSDQTTRQYIPTFQHLNKSASSRQQNHVRGVSIGTLNGVRLPVSASMINGKKY